MEELDEAGRIQVSAMYLNTVHVLGVGPSPMHTFGLVAGKIGCRYDMIFKA